MSKVVLAVCIAKYISHVNSCNAHICNHSINNDLNNASVAF